MSHCIKLASSIALSLVLVLVPVDVDAQRRPSPVPRNPYVAPTPAPAPPANPYPEAAAETTPATEEVAEEAPIADEPEPAPEPSIDQLAEAATHAPPATDGTMNALDDVLSGDDDDPIAAIEGAPEARARVPSREEAAAAIQRVTPGMRACADQSRGVVRLHIVFVSSGRVTEAEVQSRSTRLSPVQRSCIARAVRQAQVASFERPRFEVHYPLRW